ncbi:MAG TPA: hypothetical protein VF531_02140 [Bacillota bacterium]
MTNRDSPVFLRYPQYCSVKDDSDVLAANIELDDLMNRDQKLTS